MDEENESLNQRKPPREQVPQSNHAMVQVIARDLKHVLSQVKKLTTEKLLGKKTVATSMIFVSDSDLHEHVLCIVE